MADIDIFTSVGGAAFLEGLLREWKRDGWTIRRHHSLVEADYRKPRGWLGRLLRRWKMSGGYVWKCWRGARWRRGGDSIRIVTTNPFFAPALVQWFGATGAAPTIQVLYDLYPDALIHAGVLRTDSWVARCCAAITARGLRECDATVFLGASLRRHAEALYGTARRGIVIPVGADGGPFRECRPRELDDRTPTVVMYAGQMGRMHDVDTLLRAIVEGVPRALELVFHSSGVGYGRLVKAGQNAPRCHWGGPLSETEWRSAMLRAQVALVTMALGAENIVMPSKTYSAMVAGQAILAVCPFESDLADLVRQHDCGWVIEPGDVSGLYSLLNRLSGAPDEVFAKRMNAFRAGHTHYDVAVLAKQWKRLFDSLKTN